MSEELEAQLSRLTLTSNSNVDKVPSPVGSPTKNPKNNVNNNNNNQGNSFHQGNNNNNNIIQANSKNNFTDNQVNKTKNGIKQKSNNDDNYNNNNNNNNNNNHTQPNPSNYQENNSSRNNQIELETEKIIERITHEDQFHLGQTIIAVEKLIKDSQTHQQANKQEDAVFLTGRFLTITYHVERLSYMKGHGLKVRFVSVPWAVLESFRVLLSLFLHLLPESARANLPEQCKAYVIGFDKNNKSTDIWLEAVQGNAPLFMQIVQHALPELVPEFDEFLDKLKKVQAFNLHSAAADEQTSLRYGLPRVRKLVALLFDYHHLTTIISKIELFLQAIPDPHKVKLDQTLVYSFAQLLIAIGESCKDLSETIIAASQDIPWNNLETLRNTLSHSSRPPQREYLQHLVNGQAPEAEVLLRETVKSDLPKLALLMKKLKNGHVELLALKDAAKIWQQMPEPEEALHHFPPGPSLEDILKERQMEEERRREKEQRRREAGERLFQKLDKNGLTPETIAKYETALKAPSHDLLSKEIQELMGKFVDKEDRKLCSEVLFPAGAKKKTDGPTGKKRDKKQRIQDYLEQIENSLVNSEKNRLDSLFEFRRWLTRADCTIEQLNPFKACVYAISMGKSLLQQDPQESYLAQEAFFYCLVLYAGLIGSASWAYGYIFGTKHQEIRALLVHRVSWRDHSQICIPDLFDFVRTSLKLLEETVSRPDFEKKSSDKPTPPKKNKSLKNK